MSSGTINLSTNNSKLAGKIDWWSSSNGSNANTSNVTANIYVRRTDGYTTKGTWTGEIDFGGGQANFSHSSTNVSSDWVLMQTLSRTINHNSDGTGSVWIHGECYAPSGTSLAGAVVGGSQTVALDKIARYTTITSFFLKDKWINRLAYSWNATNTCDSVQYSINGGGWINTSGTTFTINNLNPNTNYTVKIRVKRQDSQLWTESGTITSTTQSIATITTISNFNLGDNPSIAIANPSSATIKLRMQVSGMTIFAKNVQNGINTITFNDTELDNIYKKMGSGNSVTASFLLDTYNGSSIGWTNTKNITITLKGNQKTIKTMVSQQYKRGKMWAKISDTWRRGVVWIKVGDVWKRGI